MNAEHSYNYTQNEVIHYEKSIFQTQALLSGLSSLSSITGLSYE